MTTCDEAKPQSGADPLEAREPGWMPVPTFGKVEHRALFVSGTDDPDRFQVRYYVRESDGQVRGKARLGPGCQGPPAHAHGGSMAALLDELMGLAAWVAGHKVLAQSIQVTFRRPLPLGQVVDLEAYVTSAEGRNVHAAARICGSNGRVIAESTGVFVEVGADRFIAMMNANQNAGDGQQ